MADDLPGSLRDPGGPGRWGVRLLPGTLLLPFLFSLHGCAKEEVEKASELPSVAAAAGSVQTALPLQVTDDLGRTLILDSLPTRIISLVPSASQTLLSLGAMDRMAGRTDFDTAAAMARLPSVGAGLHPNLEALVALEPDLVIRFAGESDATTPRRLDLMGIPYLTIQPNGIQDVRKIIADLGALTGHRARADSLLDLMDDTLAEIRDRVRGRPKVRVGYLLGGSPPWVAGPGSYIEELLGIAGGENVFSDLGGLFGPVNAEVFLAREIDVLLVAEGSEVAIPETNVPLFRVSPGVEIPGPNLADAALELARILHPEVFR